MEILNFSFGETWMDYDVSYKARKTKYVRLGYFLVDPHFRELLLKNKK